MTRFIAHREEWGLDLTTVKPVYRMEVIRPGQRAGYTIPFIKEHMPEGRVAARFTDDVGLYWQLGQGLHLLKLE